MFFSHPSPGQVHLIHSLVYSLGMGVNRLALRVLCIRTGNGLEKKKKDDKNRKKLFRRHFGSRFSFFIRPTEQYLIYELGICKNSEAFHAVVLVVRAAHIRMVYGNSISGTLCSSPPLPFLPLIVISGEGKKKLLGDDDLPSV